MGTASFYCQRLSSLKVCWMFHSCTLSSNPPPDCLCLNTQLLSHSSSANPPYSWSETQHKGTFLKVVCFYVAYLSFFIIIIFKSSVMLETELIFRRKKKSLPLHWTERIELGNSVSLLVFWSTDRSICPAFIKSVTSIM